MHRKTPFLVFFAVLACMFLLSGCSFFNTLFPTKFNVLGAAFSESVAKGLESQQDKSSQTLQDSTKTLSRAPVGYETVEEGFSIRVGTPQAVYKTVSKWSGSDTSGSFVTVTPALPPAKNDPDGPGFWEIVMDIDCVVDSAFEGYSVRGWTFEGSLAETFDAVFTYTLDIPGEIGGEAVSTLVSAITELSLDGEIAISGKDSGVLKFTGMKFQIEEVKDKHYCKHLSGTATLDGTDVSEEFIDLFEDQLEF